jgi:hypothetical protein
VEFLEVAYYESKITQITSKAIFGRRLKNFCVDDSGNIVIGLEGYGIM